MGVNEIKIIVGIPTYNRPEALVRRLIELESYVDHIKGVVVCDNSNEVNEEAKRICNLHEGWLYIKNEVNIGMGANFFRVLENAKDGTHLWWRGDDDVISTSQFEAVLGSNINVSELLILQANGNEVYRFKGILEFCENFSITQSIGWLSALIVPIDLAKKALVSGYWGIYTGYAHFCLVLGMFNVDENLSFCVEPYKFVIDEFRDSGMKEGQRWEFFNVCIKSFSQTATFIPNKEIRRIYLKEWRRYLSSYDLIKSMVFLKIGLIRHEEIKLKTLSPLLSFYNLNMIPLFFLLYFLSKIPRFIHCALFAIFTNSKSESKLVSLQVGELYNKSFLEKYKILLDIRNNNSIQNIF